MVCGNCKSVAKVPLFCNSCFQNARLNARQEGRVEGVIGELKDTLTTLKAIDSELDRRNVDMMLKTLIKVKEKRLKNLESGKE